MLGAKKEQKWKNKKKYKRNVYGLYFIKEYNITEKGKMIFTFETNEENRFLKK